VPGILGDLRNLALNPGFELWAQQTIASTSNGFVGDKWVLGLGTGSTFIASRASTGQDLGSFCAGISYTHAVASDFHQVAVLADMKSQTISFGIKVASATVGCCRPFISTDGGTTKTYGNLNTGLGATTYEQLKIEGVAVPTTATAVWFGVELVKTGTMLFDSSGLHLGSAIDTQTGPFTGKSSAAWTQTSGATVRDVDMTGTATTLVVQALGTLIQDLKALGILQ
jgi:hypothetical protein